MLKLLGLEFSLPQLDLGMEFLLISMNTQLPDDVIQIEFQSILFSLFTFSVAGRL